jgi:predicted nucleic acid-binding protein
MAGPYTVDASVYLNAFNRVEAGHIESHEFLQRLQFQAIPSIVPSLLLPEVAAAISRGRQDASLARGFATALTKLPHLTLVTLDQALAQQAVDVAAQNRLRGSDAVYAAVALRFGTTLITLDREQHDRVAKVTPTKTPAQALKELPAP